MQKRKKAKKARKSNNNNDDDDDDGPSHEDNNQEVKFGERVDNVPMFNLKRKHWTKTEEKQQERGEAVNSKGKKLGALLEQRLKEAEKKSGVHRDDRLNVTGRGVGKKTAGTSTKKKVRGEVESLVSLRHKVEQEKTRTEAIENYRRIKLEKLQQKGSKLHVSGLQVGQATAQSLKRLANNPDSMRDQ